CKRGRGTGQASGTGGAGGRCAWGKRALRCGRVARRAVRPHRGLVMTQEDAFLQAIIEQPDDDAPRLVYADWLEGRGEPDRDARAEFIRVQIELAGLPEDHPRRPELRARELGLLRRYERAWVGPLRRLVEAWEFRRGFVECAEVRGQRFLKQAETLFRFAPV